MDRGILVGHSPWGLKESDMTEVDFEHAIQLKEESVQRLEVQEGTRTLERI